ncbi:MAG: eIF2 kinase Gcn2p negative regulator [Vezdaea aestivalis]|nr:MAG: eIF2 kinase Gcn2p negative regulator [Vezdaea aestivalis]
MALSLEIQSINAIYGPTTLSEPDTKINPQILNLTLPFPPSITLALSFPASYPAHPPTVLGPASAGAAGAKKGEGTVWAERARRVLDRVWARREEVGGGEVVFDLLLGLEEEGQMEVGDLERDEDKQKEETDDSRTSGALIPAPPDKEVVWTASDPLTIHKSIFLAHSTICSDPLTLDTLLSSLRTSHKRFQSATHNMTAWRIRSSSGVLHEDFNDDGEHGAGAKLLGLLRLLGVENVVVVVSRWFGGVKLGSQRFRLIGAVARESLVRGGLVAASE